MAGELEPERGTSEGYAPSPARPWPDVGNKAQETWGSHVYPQCSTPAQPQPTLSGAAPLQGGVVPRAIRSPRYCTRLSPVGTRQDRGCVSAARPLFAPPTAQSPVGSVGCGYP